MSYAKIDDMLASYDVRKIAAELSDTGVPLTLGDVGTSDVLQQLLDEAADLILAAVQVGERYTALDLERLANGTDAAGNVILDVNGNVVKSGALLRRINSDLAYGLVVSRRGRAAADINRLAPMYAVALSYLNDLRNGLLLFPRLDDSRPKAGVPKTVDMSNNPLTPTTWVNQTGLRIFPLSTNTNYNC